MMNKHLHDGPMAGLYEPDPRDRALFGKRYIKVGKFSHGDWQTVARFEKDREDGDGQAVEIDECRLPARFFRLRVLAAKDSMGKPQPGFVLTTGSGDEVGALMVKLAEAVAGGMVGLETGGGK
jgi:hypothetical protein